MKKSLLAAAFAAAFVMSGGLALGADELVLQGGAGSWKVNGGTGFTAVDGNVIANNTITGDGTNQLTPTGQDLEITAAVNGEAGTIGGNLQTNGKTVTIGGGSGDTIDLSVTTGIILGASANDKLTIKEDSKATSLGTSSTGIGSIFEIETGAEYDVKGTMANAGTLNIVGTLTSSGKTDNSGIMQITGTWDNNAGVTSTNTGVTIFDSTATYTTNGDGIKNDTYLAHEKGATLKVDGTGLQGYMIDTTGNNADDLIADIILGGTSGTGGSVKNIGNIALTDGTAAATNTWFAGTTEGNVYLQGDVDDSLDVYGANLILTNGYSNDVATGEYLSGKNIYIDGAATYVSDFAAWGSQANNTTDTLAVKQGKADGTIFVMQDSEFQSALYAKTIKADADTTLGVGTEYKGGLDIATGKTITNQALVDGDVDLSGYTIEGAGDLINDDGASITIKGVGKDKAGNDANTNITMTGKIFNADTGEAGTIITDSAGIKALGTGADSKLSLAGKNDAGIGTIEVDDNLDIANLDWGTAKGGDMTVGGDYVNGTINIGDANMSLDKAAATVKAGSTVNALTFTFNANNQVNNGTINGNIAVADGVTGAKNSSTGILNIDAGEDLSFLYVGTGNDLTNDGKIIVGDLTVVTAAAGSIKNAKGTLEMTGGMNQGAMGTLLAGLDTADVGTINVSGNLRDKNALPAAADNNFDLSGALKGSVTFKDKLTMKDNPATFINTGKASATFDGAGNEVDGTIDGGDITFTKKSAGGVYGGTVTADGKLVIDGDNNVFKNGIASTGGTTIAKDIHVTVWNSISGDTNIGDNTVFNVLADGTTNPANTMLITNGTLTTGYNTILDFASDNTGIIYALTVDTNDATKGTLNLAYDPSASCGGSRLMVNNGATYTDATVITSEALATLQFHTKNKAAWAATDEEIDAYLKNQSFESITQSNDFKRVAGTGGDEVVYNGYRVNENDPEAYIQWRKGLDTSGLLDKEGMIDQATKDQMYAYADLTQTQLDGLTPEQRQLAIIFNKMGGGFFSCLTTGGFRESASNAQWATGMDLAGSLEAVNDTVRSFSRAIAKRSVAAAQYDECGNPIDPYCDSSITNRIWAGYSGQWGNQKSRDWDEGYKYDAHGFNVGYDLFASGGMSFGAAYGYSKGDYENKMALADDSKIENHSFGLYGAYTHTSGFYASALATYTRSEYKMNNQFSTYTGTGITGWDQTKYKGNTWSVGGEIGYDFRPYETLTITPSVGVYHYSVKTKDFDTSTRTGMKYSRTQTEMPIDVAVKYDLHAGENSTLSFVVNGGYSYNFTNKGTKVHQFTYAGDPTETLAGGTRYVKPGRSGWNVGGGLQFKYKSFDIGADYEYYGRRGYTSHNVNANVGVSF